MKKQLLLISLALVSMFSFASNNPEEDEKSANTAEAKAESHVMIYKGLYLSMDDEAVKSYIVNELNGKPETNGDYVVKFFDQDAFMRPIYDEGKLERVEIILRASYSDDVINNLKNLETTIAATEGWKESKASDEQWLFEKDLDKTVDNMNQITIYTYGIHADKVGGGWHTQIQIAPRFQGQSLSEEEINERSQEFQSLIN
ncbi:hypothetical protein [Flammeovirga aprica]|uniref:Uncharacterized protein n=1 Tax=Flammeovirga aprica JL-4 TaxID=694437 RepID=A0A7X9RVW9_9BACT|nr:hypothetical protein [Flammeovirga aprica]NME69609.1 hypothetical protein [Flammeovirga aprica JL-4]